MAKFYGSSVKTGRLGGSVFAVRNGVTIERQYQPQVANPSTSLQVAARARLKLMSQLSEALAPAIAFRREGLVSARNKFTKENYYKSMYDDGAATINYKTVDLTGGVLAIPVVSLQFGQNVLNATLQEALDGFDRVVYSAYKVQNNELRFVGQVTAEAGVDKKYTTTIPAVMTNGDWFVLYAYAIRFNTETARATYEQMEVESMNPTATVAVLRNLVATDYTLSETVADSGTYNG